MPPLVEELESKTSTEQPSRLRKKQLRDESDLVKLGALTCPRISGRRLRRIL